MGPTFKEATEQSPATAHLARSDGIQRGRARNRVVVVAAVVYFAYLPSQSQRNRSDRDANASTIRCKPDRRDQRQYRGTYGTRTGKQDQG